MLSITKEEFLEIYAGLNICNYVDTFYSEPTSDKDMIENYFTSKLWRLNNLYYIVNKYGKRILFRMNKSQHRVYAASLRHPRLIILKSRQQGISTLWLISFFDDSITRRDLSIGLMAQGTDEASKLLERVKLLWDTLNDNVKKYFKLSISTDNAKEVGFSTGSKLFIRTSFRSTTLQRLHVSEMGKISNKYPEKAKETKTGTLQALAPGNIGIIESTAEGDNDFKEMWDNAYTFTGKRSLKDFAPVFLSWLDDKDCEVEEDQVIDNNAEKYFNEIQSELGIELTKRQKNFWIVQYRELGDKIYQEYPATPQEAFRATKQGTYYAEEFAKHVILGNRAVENLFDPNLDVGVAVDLGMNDTNVLVVYQLYKDTYRIIDEFADNGHKISHYTDWMKTRTWYSNLTELVIGHDGVVRDLTSGQTREAAFREELSKPLNPGGPIPQVVVRSLERASRLTGIDEVRKMIGRLWIDSKCTYLIKCFLNYRKEWNEKTNRYNDTHYHDEHSNGADAVRYMVMGARKHTTYTPVRHSVSSDFDV